MLLWYTARGAGLAALVLLTVATAGGALQSSRRISPARRVVLQYAHRSAAVAGLLVVVLHVVTVLFDSYAGVGLVGAFVPSQSGYRAWQVALGTISLYGFVAVAALGAARRAMSRSERGVRLWRGLHLTSYAFWATAMVHGFTTGTDMTRSWAVGLTVACIATVVGAACFRLAEPRAPHVPVRRRTVEVAR